MAVYQDHIQFTPQWHVDMQDLTDRVQQAIQDSGFQVGIVNVFNIGSTEGIGAMEFELVLKQDLPDLLNRLIPLQ